MPEIPRKFFWLVGHIILAVLGNTVYDLLKHVIGSIGGGPNRPTSSPVALPNRLLPVSRREAAS